uniref:NB-ARC domain-containing protein n=1 Tax=Quercus lobata TaxID=97700 RepID=A0A7N2M1I3_QUELO
MKIISLVVDIGGNLVAPMRKHFCYLSYCNCNIKNLKDQFQKLGDKRAGVQLEIDVAKQNRELIAPEVESWVEKVDNISEATKKTLEIDGLLTYQIVHPLKVLRDGQFDKVSYPPPPRGIATSSKEGFKVFESRIPVMKEVLTALRDDKINMIAICGMEGIGKTTMAKEVAKRAKDDNLFDEVVMVVVSSTTGNSHFIQGRSEEVCNQMKSHKIVRIEALTEEEAWSFFKEMAGHCIDTPNLRPIAEKVAKECKGIPIAIVTVGRALENKRKNEWVAALQQLRKSISKNNSVRFGVGQRLFAKIDKVAEARNRVHAMVDNLRRSSLLLDSDEEECVKMHDVVRGVAISIANGHVLQNLQTLLLEYCEIKDVSAIGALGKLEMLSFLGSEIKELPREIGNLSHLNLLDLSKCSALQRIPPGLLSSLSRLEELYMGNVSVMNWEPTEGNREGANASLAELSFGNYSTFWNTTGYIFKSSLVLEGFVASDIAESQIPRLLLQKSELVVLRGIKDFENILYKLDEEGFPCLELLSSSYSEDVEYLIDATSYQTPRVAFPILQTLILRELPNLKEIYHSQIPQRSFSGTHSQLACFGNLKSLHLSECKRLKNVSSLSIARELGLLPRLIGFCTSVGLVVLVQPSLFNQEVRRIDTTGSFPDSTPISHKFFSSKTILWQPNVKELSLLNANEHLEVVFDLEGQKDDNDHQRIAVLAELKTLIVNHLLNLRYLFPPTVAKLLVELQSIKIWWCDMIEHIVQRDGEEEAEDIILFPKLTSFNLYFLPNLMSFCIEPYSFEWSSMEKIDLYKCPKFKTYDQGTTKKFQESSSVNKEGILTKDPKANDVDNNSKTWSLFPSHFIVCLKNLKTIELSNRDSLEVIFQLEELNVEESHMAPMLDQLRKLDLSDLPKLMHIWKKGPERIMGFRNLRLSDVSRCNSLTYLFSPSIAKFLVMLEKIRVVDCEKIEEILARAGEEKEEKERHLAPGPERIMGFGNLRLLDVRRCNSLTYLFSPSIAKLLVMLEEIRVYNCAKVEEILARAGEEEEEKERHMAPVLNQLRELDLYFLPKLMHIWKKGLEWIFGFRNLRLLKVSGCDSLTYLFSPSIAKVLVMLEKIKVRYCEKIEEILAKAGKEEKEKDVLFDKVNSIKLSNLPNLKGFCSETNALEWPSLEEITVMECPSLSTFIPSNLNTPKLEGVYDNHPWIEERTCHWKGDLNATIEHIFKGKPQVAKEDMMLAYTCRRKHCHKAYEKRI